MWRNQTIPLALSCTLTSISSQTNSRLTTSKCPFSEARPSAVIPDYIFFLPSTKFKSKKLTNPNRGREIGHGWDKLIIPVTPSCKLTSISSQANSRLTTSKCPFREAHISTVHSSFYIFFHHQRNFHSKTTSEKKKLEKKNFGDGECGNNQQLATDLVLQINTNLFAVQQATDDIQMSIP